MFFFFLHKKQFNNLCNNSKTLFNLQVCTKTPTKTYKYCIQRLVCIQMKCIQYRKFSSLLLVCFQEHFSQVNDNSSMPPHVFSLWQKHSCTSLLKHPRGVNIIKGNSCMYTSINISRYSKRQKNFTNIILSVQEKNKKVGMKVHRLNSLCTLLYSVINMKIKRVLTAYLQGRTRLLPVLHNV